MPVLGVYPTQDGALTEQQMTASGAFVKQGGWQYRRLEGSGHWPQRDAPDALTDELLRFLKDGGGDSGGDGGGGGGGRVAAARSRL